jgi:hypothetical protein
MGAIAAANSRGILVWIIATTQMAGVVQCVFSTKTALLCCALWSGASSPAAGLLLIFLLFFLFLAPFDRRLLERYIQRVNAAATRREAAAKKVKAAAAIYDTAIGGPFTRQLCDMLDLEVVVLRDARSSHVRSFLGELAIGRWNKAAQKFEVVTAWCETWADLEDEARRAIKSFHGMANSKTRGESRV